MRSENTYVRIAGGDRHRAATLADILPNATAKARVSNEKRIRQGRPVTVCAVCPNCGGPKSPTSKRCHGCYAAARALARRIDKTPVTISPRDAEGGPLEEGTVSRPGTWRKRRTKGDR